MLSRFAELFESHSHEAILKIYKFQSLTCFSSTGPRIAIDLLQSDALIKQTKRGGAYVSITVLEGCLCETVDASGPDLVAGQSVFSWYLHRVAWHKTTRTPSELKLMKSTLLLREKGQNWVAGETSVLRLSHAERQSRLGFIPSDIPEEKYHCGRLYTYGSTLSS